MIKSAGVLTCSAWPWCTWHVMPVPHLGAAAPQISVTLCMLVCVSLRDHVTAVATHGDRRFELTDAINWDRSKD